MNVSVSAACTGNVCGWGQETIDHPWGKVGPVAEKPLHDPFQELEAVERRKSPWRNLAGSDNRWRA